MFLGSKLKNLRTLKLSEKVGILIKKVCTLVLRSNSSIHKSQKETITFAGDSTESG